MTIGYLSGYRLTRIASACFSESMTQRSNHLRNAHGPRTAARAVASRAVNIRGRVLVAALAIASLITVLVLITSPLRAEYGFV
jgi:hypothetical protein